MLIRVFGSLDILGHSIVSAKELVAVFEFLVLSEGFSLLRNRRIIRENLASRPTAVNFIEVVFDVSHVFIVFLLIPPTTSTCHLLSSVRIFPFCAREDLSVLDSLLSISLLHLDALPTKTDVGLQIEMACLNLEH